MRYSSHKKGRDCATHPSHGLGGKSNLLYVIPAIPRVGEGGELAVKPQTGCPWDPHTGFLPRHTSPLLASYPLSPLSNMSPSSPLFFIKKKKEKTRWQNFMRSYMSERFLLPGRRAWLWSSFLVPILELDLKDSTISRDNLSPCKGKSE